MNYSKKQELEETIKKLIKQRNDAEYLLGIYQDRLKEYKQKLDILQEKHKIVCHQYSTLNKKWQIYGLDKIVENLHKGEKIWNIKQ